MKRSSGCRTVAVSSAIVIAGLLATPADAGSTVYQSWVVLSERDLKIVNCMVKAVLECDLDQVAEIEANLWPPADEPAELSTMKQYLPALRGPSPAEALRRYATPESSGAFDKGAW